MRLLWIPLALGLFQADQAIGHEIDSRLDFDQERRLAGGRLRLKKHYNYGLAGGRLAGHATAVFRISGTATLVCAALFAGALFKSGHTAEKAGWTALTGGALSNLYDRCRRGYVVDYLNFQTPWKRLNRLVFNLADFFILAGALLICLGQMGNAQG